MAVTLTNHVTATGLSTSMPLNRIGAADNAELGKWLFVFGVISGTPTPATGWTLVGSKLIAGSRQLRLFSKQHEGASEPATYTFTSGTSSRYILHGVMLEGHHSDAPPDVATGADSSNVSQTNAPVASIDPTVEDALLVIFTGAAGVTTFTPPANYTEFSDFPAASQISSQLCYRQAPNGDPTGTMDVTLAAANVTGTFHISFKPAAAGGTDGTMTATPAAMTLGEQSHAMAAGEVMTAQAATATLDSQTHQLQAGSAMVADMAEFILGTRAGIPVGWNYELYVEGGQVGILTDEALIHNLTAGSTVAATPATMTLDGRSHGMTAAAAGDMIATTAAMTVDAASHALLSGSALIATPAAISLDTRSHGMIAGASGLMLATAATMTLDQLAHSLLAGQLMIATPAGMALAGGTAELRAGSTMLAVAAAMTLDELAHLMSDGTLLIVPRLSATVRGSVVTAEFRGED